MWAFHFLGHIRHPSTTDSIINPKHHIMTMVLKILECRRCTHKWASKITPKQCPSCKSNLWDKLRVRKWGQRAKKRK